MKRKMILLLILAAAALLYIFLGQPGSKPSGVSAGTESLETFPGAAPFLNIAFEYPKNWKVFVSRSRTGEEATVQLMGPRDLAYQFSTSFAIIGKKKTEGGSMEGEAEKLIERNKALAQFKVVSKRTVQAAGQTAQDVTFDFVMPLPVGTLNAPVVTMREEVILVSRKDALYQVHFVGTREQHQQSKPLFESLLRSLRFTN